MSKKLHPGFFYGTTERRYDLEGLTLAETVYPAGLVIPPHEHANAFFCLLLEGHCTQSCDSRTSTGGPLTLTAYPAALAHANRWHDTGGRALHVEFAQPWLERLRGRTAVLDRPADYEGGPPVWLAKRLVAECRQQDDVSALAVEGLVLELLAACSRSPAEVRHANAPRWLKRVRDLLRGHFSENLALGQVAAAVGVSADHLARTFRHYQGCTLGEYVRRLRVEASCRRLAGSESPLVQVALDAGFADQSHFTKTFKRYMGVTPAAFRNLHRRRMSCTKS
jgi:AraC family transcriptional regulator